MGKNLVVGLDGTGNENRIPYAARVYARRTGKDSDLARSEGFARMDRFAEALSVSPVPGSPAFPVEYLGVFDTVKATRFLGRDPHRAYTNKLPDVRVVRHAVAIGEKRRPHRESLIPPPPAGQAPEVTETWFAGVHSDAGTGHTQLSHRKPKACPAILSACRSAWPVSTCTAAAPGTGGRTR